MQTSRDKNAEPDQPIARKVPELPWAENEIGFNIIRLGATVPGAFQAVMSEPEAKR
jgi:hypothetical protein